MGINTVKLGDALEERVYNVLKHYLETDQLFIPGNRTKIYWKRKYFSKDRQDDIIFDIAFETYRQNASEYALLTLVEVKNYTGSVPVNDIEEFESKIRQVGGHNIKGLFVTNAPLQKSAFQVAISKKIGIIQINENDSLEFIAERNDSAGWIKTLDYLTAQLTSESGRNSFVATIDGLAFKSISSLLRHIGVIDNWAKENDAIKLDYIDEKAIEKRLAELQLQDCYDRYKLNTDKLCEHMSMLYDVEFEFEESLAVGGNLAVLGKIIYNPLKIYITQQLKTDTNRWRFTLAHEISHLILHYHLFLDHYVTRQGLEDNLFRPDWDFPDPVKKRMEHQANLMASNILLPLRLLDDFIPRYFAVERIHRGFIYVDQRPINQKAFIKILQEMENLFGVSKEVAKLRLLNLKLIRGEVQDNSVHTHLRNQGYDTWSL